MSIANILAVYAAATPSDRFQGGQWYPEAHGVAKHLARRYGVSLPAAAGVIAALSPRNRWERNLQDAEAVLTRAGRAVVCTFKMNKTKAVALRKVVDREAALEYLVSPKLRNFFLNILDPSEGGPVTIDVHAASVAAGRRLTGAEGHVRNSAYGKLADEYRAAAQKLNILPHVLQAITWVAWRNSL